MNQLTITDAKIIETNKRERVTGGVYISFLSIENAVKGDVFEMEFENKKHYFAASDISISGESLEVSAREVGYWCSKFDFNKDFDLRKIIGVSVSPINDREVLKKVHEMSCWL
jgi:hypothetical protein